MRIIGIVGIALAGALAAGWVVSPADAAGKKRSATWAYDRAVPSKRAKTRITVRRQSYLNAGTTVYQGSKSYTNYIIPPGYSAFTTYVDPTRSGQATPGPFQLDSYHAPGGF